MLYELEALGCLFVASQNNALFKLTMLGRKWIMYHLQLPVTLTLIHMWIHARHPQHSMEIKPNLDHI